MSKNRSGFAAIEAALIIILLAIVGAAGWYIYHASNTAENTYNSANGDQPVVVPKAKKQPGVTAEQAEARVQAAYTNYLNTAKNGKTGATNLTSVKSALTPDLYRLLSEQYQKQPAGSTTDLFTCATTVPASVQAHLISSTKVLATVNVAETFTGSKAAIGVVVDLSSGLIQSLQCKV